HLIGVAGIVGQVVLDRIDVMVNVVLGTTHVPGETPHPVIDGDHVGIKAVDQIVQYFQRRDQAAGRYINIRPEGADTFVGVAFRVGVYRYVALVQVPDNGLRQGARGFLVVGFAVAQFV